MNKLYLLPEGVAYKHPLSSWQQIDGRTSQPRYRVFKDTKTRAQILQAYRYTLKKEIALAYLPSIKGEAILFIKDMD